MTTEAQYEEIPTHPLESYILIRVREPKPISPSHMLFMGLIRKQIHDAVTYINGNRSPEQAIRVTDVIFRSDVDITVYGTDAVQARAILDGVLDHELDAAKKATPRNTTKDDGEQ